MLSVITDTLDELSKPSADGSSTSVTALENYQGAELVIPATNSSQEVSVIEAPPDIIDTTDEPTFWKNTTVADMEGVLEEQKQRDTEMCIAILHDEGLVTWDDFRAEYQAVNNGRYNRLKDRLGYTVKKRQDGGFALYRSTNSYLANFVRKYY